MAIDILMKIRKEGGFLGVAGETGIVIDRGDELTKDFSDGKYIAISNFRFGISLVDEDPPTDPNKQEPKTNVPKPHTVVATRQNETQGEDSDRHEIQRDGKFKRFMQGKALSSGSKRLYPVAFDEVSIEREIDNTAPSLLQTCFNVKDVAELSIVKRRSAGQDLAGKAGVVPYFRVDFKDVLLTDISYQIGETTLTETLKFVFREVSVKYRPQNNDGSPGDVVPAGPLSLANPSDAKKK